jgi:hypothetical protein
MPAFKDLSGQRFSRLLVKERASNSGRRTRFICVCDCGTVLPVWSEKLVSGNTRSCGCYRHDRTVEVNSQINRVWHDVTRTPCSSGQRPEQLK